MSVHVEQQADRSVRTERACMATCLAGAALAVAVVPLMGGLDGDTGAAVTGELVARAGGIQLAAMLAVLAGAALLLASVRLGRTAGGAAGGVLVAAGAAVAVLMVAMYAAFGAGAVVGSLILAEPSPAVGESTLLMVNLVEITRFAPSTALLVAGLAAGHALPKALRVVAWVLLALTLVPFTTWAVALAVPVWLGLAGATARGVSA